MKRIFRFEVPVDDKSHWHQCSEPLYVACRRLSVVEFWAYPDDVYRVFRVVGTGHDVPDDAVYRGTTIAPGGQLVWHLIQVSS